MEQNYRDIFLSHAGKDKEDFINPLVKLLEQREISYWLDEAELSLGKSLLKLISEGIEKSKFVIFLRNKDSNVIPHKVGKKQLKGKKSSSFDPRSEIIIKKLYQQGSGMSTNQLAKATQLPYLTVQRKLKKLKEYDAVVEEVENVEDNKGKEGKRGKTTRFSLNYSEIKNV